MENWQAEMRRKLADAGFSSVVITQHGGKAPRWMAYGDDAAGRYRHTTFFGEPDWRSALRTIS